MQIGTIVKVGISICLLVYLCIFLFGKSLRTKEMKVDHVGMQYHNRPNQDEIGEDGLTYQEKIAKAAEIQAKQSAHEYNNEFHLLFIFTKLKDNPKLLKKLHTSLGSMFEYAAFDSHEILHIHFVCDEEGREKAESYLQKFISHPKFTLKVHFHDVDFFVSELKTKMALVQKVLGSSHPRYDDILFLLSLSIHNILPLKIHKIIQLDLDLKFTTNVRLLWNEFNKFTRDQMFGMAHENQPVYRHLLWKYRKNNPETEFGNPPPHGNPGYNSGVILIHLHRLRYTNEYNSYLKADNMKKLLDKYSFDGGHLGDQDFFTLLSFEKPQYFYTLGCGWNKQLCDWWKNKGYESIFHEYFECHQQVNIWHGNCDTAFPE